MTRSWQEQKQKQKRKRKLPLVEEKLRAVEVEAKLLAEETPNPGLAKTKSPLDKSSEGLI